MGTRVARRLAVVALLAGGLLVVVLHPGPVRALASHFGQAAPAAPAGGPHGGYSSATDLCRTCHRPHDAPASPLLTTAQPALCYGCHGTGASPDVQAAFAATGSTHPIATLTCTGCHTPHLAPADDARLLKPPPPAGTLIGNAFCYGCHPGTTGFESSGHRGKVTASAADGGIQCVVCHEPHGSSNALLLKERGGMTGFRNAPGDQTALLTFCASCHGSVDDHRDGHTLCSDCHDHDAAAEKPI